MTYDPQLADAGEDRRGQKLRGRHSEAARSACLLETEICESGGIPQSEM